MLAAATRYAYIIRFTDNVGLVLLSSVFNRHLNLLHMMKRLNASILAKFWLGPHWESRCVLRSMTNREMITFLFVHNTCTNQEVKGQSTFRAARFLEN